MKHIYPMSEEQCKICIDDWKRLNSGPLRPIKSDEIMSINESAFIGSKTRPDIICGLCESMFVKYHPKD